MTIADVRAAIETVQNHATAGRITEAQDAERGLLLDFAARVSEGEWRKGRLVIAVLRLMAVAREVMKVRYISFPRGNNV